MGTILITTNLNLHTRYTSPVGVRGQLRGAVPITHKEWMRLFSGSWLPLIRTPSVLLFHTLCTKNGELLNCTFVILERLLRTICKAVINVSHCFSTQLSLFVLQTSQMCLLFLHHELRVLSKVDGSVGQHGTWLLEFIDLKCTWQVFFWDLSRTVRCNIFSPTFVVPLQVFMIKTVKKYMSSVHPYVLLLLKFLMFGKSIWSRRLNLIVGLNFIWLFYSFVTF